MRKKCNKGRQILMPPAVVSCTSGCEQTETMACHCQTNEQQQMGHVKWCQEVKTTTSTTTTLEGTNATNAPCVGQS